MKINLYVSDDGWEGLKQMAYEQGYVRGVKQDDRPRGMSPFVGMLAMVRWRDNRPEYMKGTSQWMTGLQKVRQRCLELPAAALADLGLIALEHEIYPYRTQLAVANGYRREANPPVLHALGSAPRGSVSVTALAGPVLDAIGLRYLVPAVRLPHAPPNLYQGPSRRYNIRERRRAEKRTVM
jgi:hypothetical protein